VSQGLPFLSDYKRGLYAMTELCARNDIIRTRCRSTPRHRTSADRRLQRTVPHRQRYRLLAAHNRRLGDALSAPRARAAQHTHHERAASVRARVSRIWITPGNAHRQRPASASTGLHGLTRLNVWWLRLGIQNQRNRSGIPEDRPHEALADHPLGAHDEPSHRPYPKTLPALEYPGNLLVKLVTNVGTRDE
jgi:hypothetical protein